VKVEVSKNTPKRFPRCKWNWWAQSPIVSAKHIQITDGRKS